MLVLDYPRVTSVADPAIALPPFHTGHLGFVPDTPVFIGIVTPQKQHSELVIAPFSQDWRYLAAVTVTMRDRPGVVSRLATALAALDINIETQESASVNHLDEHFVNLIVDFSSSPRLSVLLADTPAPVQRLYRAYSSVFALHDFRFVQLFESIMIRCADVVVWHSVSGEWFPDISIKALPYRPLAKPSTSMVSRAGGPLQAQVSIPANIAVTLRAALGVTGEFQYISISDTTTRSLRVFFLHPSTVGALFHIGVYHDDVPGALAAILTLLREAQFNILTSLTRKQPDGRSVWEALVQYVGDAKDIPAPEDRVAHSPPAAEDIEWVRARLVEAAPRDGSDFAKYSIKLGPPRYPKRGAGRARQAPSAKRESQGLPGMVDLEIPGAEQPEARTSESSNVAQLIASRREELKQEETDEEVRERIDDLLTTIQRRSEVGEQPTIFFSFPRAANAHGMVDKLMERLEPWYVASYYQKPDGKLILDEAIRLIEESDYFIGIWHPDSIPDGKNRVQIFWRDLMPGARRCCWRNGIRGLGVVPGRGGSASSQRSRRCFSGRVA